MNGVEGIILGFLVVFSILDLRAGKIPVLLIGAFGIFALGYQIWNHMSFGELAAGVIPGIVFLLLAWVTRESIGYGDGLVLLVTGVFCGIVKTIGVIGMSLVFASLLSMILLVLKRAERKTELPFLPCLCSGYLVSLLW